MEDAGAWVPVTAPDGGKFEAYVSGTRGPTILVLQEIFGINAHIRSVVDRLAAEGYRVVAPDLFWRMQPHVELGFDQEQMQQAFGFMSRFDAEQGIADAAAALRQIGDGGKTGVVGFCLGGMLTYLFTIYQHPTCGVAYYPVGMANLLDHAPKLDRPLMIHFGETDDYADAGVRESVQSACGAKPGVEIHLYEGAGHAFNNDTRTFGYDPEAAKLAWDRTLAFFAKHLK